MASTNFVLEGQESPEVEPSAEQMKPGSFAQTIRRTMRDELLDNLGLPLSSTCRLSSASHPREPENRHVPCQQRCHQRSYA